VTGTFSPKPGLQSFGQPYARKMKARAEERKAQAELFVMWLPGIVGLIGALIGLLSILKVK
jgi:hypothetical protein